MSKKNNPVKKPDPEREQEVIRFSAPAEVETPNWRTTWGHRAAIADRNRTAVRQSVPERPEFETYRVLITRVGANVLDDDNLVAACKAARDELAAWLGLDDGDARIQFAYAQRKELIRDEDPRARRKLRTWLEFEIMPGNSQPGPENQPRPEKPPTRLIREKTHAPYRTDLARPPSSSIPVGSSGLTVDLTAAPDGRPYVRVCKYFNQQGHAWRTTGVAVELEDVDAFVQAILDIQTKAT